MKLEKMVFNYEYKQAFMETLGNDKQKEQALGLFKKTKEFEEDLNTDIYDMRLSDFDALIKSLMFTGFNPAIRDVSLLNKYNLWAMSKGYTSNMNVKEIDTSHKNLRKYFYKNFNSVYSKETIERAVRNMPTRLGLIAELVFYGLKGSSALDEIRYLKVEHLLETEEGLCFVKLERGDVEISKDLHDRLIRFNMTPFDKETDLPYIDSEYIFKQIDRGSNINKGIIIRHTIGTSVMQHLKIALKDKSCTLNTLRLSGFNYFAYKHMKESGKMVLTKDVLRELASRYKIGINNKGFWNYNLLMDWVYVEKIEEFYDCEVEIGDKL